MSTYCAAAGLLTLAACGGGGGGSTSSGTTSISGVAATGAAFGDASVSITDANGTVTSCGTTNTSTGAYTCTLPSTAVAPFVIRALSTETGMALFSVLPEKKDSTANITPLTNAIAAALSPTGDPSTLASQINANTATVTTTTINTQVGLLQSGLQNVLTAASVTTFDPIGGSLTAGSGTGMDKVLDTVKITVAPQSDTGAGTQAGAVTIALRADPDTTLSLTNGSNAMPTAISTTTVTAALSLNPSDLISELLGKMNTCFALAVGTRVTDQSSAATAANVTAPECTAIFHTSPSTFKSGGNVVGAKGAFKGLFSGSATGATFDKGNLEYVVKNPGAANDGVWVVSYRVTQADGTISYDTFGLRLDANNKLRQYGNQYDYDTSVRPFVQDREFVNQLASNYLSTGYVLNITNKVDGSGNSIFAKVVVTSPDGNKTFTLKPTAGMSYLGLATSPSNTLGTNFVRIGYGPTDSSASAWTSSANVSGSEASRLFFATTKWNDSEIAAIPNQGTWTFDIYLASNPSAIAVTQKARTLNRAPTMAELRKQKFAALTTTQRAEILTNTATNHWYVMDGNGVADITDANANNAWTVPDGALAPTKATIYGNAPYTTAWGNSFNDFTTFLGSARKTSINCSRQSNADAHCAAGVSVGSTGNYASGTRITELQLNASSPVLDTSKHIAFYLP